MMRRLLIGLCLLALPAFAQAQVIGLGSLTALNSTVAFNPGPVPVITFNVSGTYSGTVTFQCDSNGGGTYTSLLATNVADGSLGSTTTSTGNFAVPNAGCVSVQVKMTGYVSGTANISYTRGYWMAKSPFLPGPSYAPVTADCSAPSYSYSNDPNTGNTSVSADTVSQCAGATEVTRATASQFQVLVSQIPFGGTTSSFPMLKRSSAQIQFRLADDSGFAYGRVAGFLFGSGSTFDDTGDGTFRFTDSGGSNGFTHVVTTDGTDYCKSRAGADTCTVKAANLIATSNITGGDTVWPTGVTRELMRSDADGKMRFANNGNTVGVEINTGTAAPTVTTCGTGTITTGSRNSAGQFTATGATACTVTFGAPNWANAPFCVVSEVTAAPLSEPSVSASSATAITISNLTAGDVINYICIGRI